MMSFATIALAASTAVAAAQPTSHRAAPGETLSENTWDFNAPYGVPGFAPMRPTDDVRAMVAGMHSGPSLLGDVTLAASVGSLGGSKAAETTAEADRSAGLYKWANWIFGAR